jgi:hypothetical protein
MEDNQTQTTSTDSAQAPETTQSINTDSPVITTDSPAPEMPLEAPESPTNVVDTPPNKDDNGVVITAESQVENAPEINETPTSNTQTPVKSSNFSSDEQTAQMVGNEPIRTQGFIRGLLEKAKLAIQNRKRNKLDKIMNLFAKQTNITNDEVEKYLHVSDATATRYLGILIKEGKIKQEGKTGKSVFYTLVK